jgi:PAS domain S-box-containing protein
VAISLAVLGAWASQEWVLIQFSSEFAPLHYNAGLLLLVWGASLLSIALGRNRLGRLLGGILILASLFLLLENQKIFHLGADRWWFSPDPHQPAFPPSGLYPAGLIGLFLGGLTLILMAQATDSTMRSLLIAMVGGMILIRSLVMVFGIHVGGKDIEPLGPPILGMLAFIFGGLAALIFAFRKGANLIPVSQGPPLLVSLAGMALTFVLWQALNSQRNQRIQRTVQFEAFHLDHLLQDSAQSSFVRLIELAEQSQRKTIEEIKDDVDAFVVQRPGCVGVAKIDGTGNVQWIESRNLSSPPRTRAEFGVDDNLVPALQLGKMIMARAPRSFWKGDRALVVFAPALRDVPNQGGLIAVLKLKDWLDTILNPNAAPGYALAIQDKEQEIYGRFVTETAYKDLWQQTLPLHLRGQSWKLQVWPTQEVMERESLSLPKIALAVGLLTTTLLALAVHLARTARWRARELEKEIQERKHAEGALKQSEEKYRTLVEHLEQGVFLKDGAGRFVTANSSYCRSIGKLPVEVIGRTVAELFPESVARERNAEDRQVLLEGRKIESEQEIEIDGKRRVIRRILSPVLDASGKPSGLLGICWDVTEQRALETRLRQAGKMDAIGQLAGGIAHDFNNLLTAIMGNLDLLLAGLTPGARPHELALSAQTAVTRAASLTNRLLGFSRQHQLDWQPTDLNVIVSEVVTLLQRTIDPRIKLEVRKGSHLWLVQADASQLNQVLMNLCLNARDAINGAGRIFIETATVEVGIETALTIPADARFGSYVRLRVSDTGTGMPPEVHARIFEPFFTTKEVGKGTGLGLAMVFAIVKQHAGWIECRSKVGDGTTFDIYLPRTNAVAKPTHLLQTKPAPIKAGHETILIVDDEPMIRKLAAVVLGNKGYRIIEAEDGLQAVEIYDRSWPEIDLVVLDLTMPNLSGQDAFRQMLLINPDVKALFASGYAAEQLSDSEQDRILGFVKKPYRPDELVSTVQETLERIKSTAQRRLMPIGAANAGGGNCSL